MPVMKVLLAAATLALSLGQAGAVCLSHDPLDPRCTVNDFLIPTRGAVSVYARTPASRQGEIGLCTAPGGVRRPDPSWCAAAFAAQRAASGAFYGRHYP